MASEARDYFESCSGDFKDNEYKATMTLITRSQSESICVFLKRVLLLVAHCWVINAKDASSRGCKTAARGRLNLVVGQGRNWTRMASVSLKINLVLVTQMCVYDTINCVLISCGNK